MKPQKELKDSKNESSGVKPELFVILRLLYLNIFLWYALSPTIVIFFIQTLYRVKLEGNNMSSKNMYISLLRKETTSNLL